MCFGRIRYRWRRVAGAIRSLVNSLDLQLECARVLYETLLVSVRMYGSETMLWNEKERSRIYCCIDEQPQVLGGWIEPRMHGQGTCVE